VTPLRAFFATQNAGAIVLVAATGVALVWANSPWSSTYEKFWTTDVSVRFGATGITLELREWINDGLMAFFFFVVGLEIRREFDMGELRERRRLATPVVAAIGGIIAPALIYLAFNGGTPDAKGWGIAIGTDTAFALGVLALVGRDSPPRLRVFLLTLVVVDDIAALVIIAIAYTDDLSIAALAVAVGLYCVAILMRRAGVRNRIAYFAIALTFWVAVLESGIHPTIAGVALGLLATAYPPTREALQRAGTLWRLFREQPTPEFARTASTSVRLAVSPNERLQSIWQPWTVYVIVPLFALANAGVTLSHDAIESGLTSRITLGIIFGLVIGKLVGITGATWLATRRRLGGLPLTIPWPPLVGAATVAGIGFTVALLIAHISFEGEQLENAQLGILGASIAATLLSWFVFRVIERLPDRLARAGEQSTVGPIIDLSDPVDPERDHIRGPADAAVTLVEYGDFECPYCGQAEPVVRELLATSGGELRYVFRHLPLVDVHEHAEEAAEAAEAAGEQGAFWEMHDRLFDRKSTLGIIDVNNAACDIGLDIPRFEKALQTRRFALRVQRDIDSANDSGVAGTPTFFINGHRHEGAYDIESLRAAIDREARTQAAVHSPPVDTTEPAPRDRL
jgi:Na+/H+ antiporter NhaA